MNKTRIALGYTAGAILVLSSGLHSLMGWPGVRAELAKAQLPDDLLFAMQMAWNFGGMSMLAFGVGVLSMFRDAARGRALPKLAVLAIGAGYLAFGVAQFIASHFAPFTFIFIVPGALLLAALRPSRAASATA